MALELQRAVVAGVLEVTGAGTGKTPPWLLRPGRTECRSSWSLVQRLYQELTGGAELPDTMPPRERRSVDCVLVTGDAAPRILEVDETQHFNQHRALTLRVYEHVVPLAFPARDWIAECEAKLRLEGGGFARACPPLFPEAGGRHIQRAFRDALCDVLPGEHGWLPTLRIADFEVEAWIFGPDAAPRMRSLLAERDLTDSQQPSSGGGERAARTRASRRAVRGR